MLEKMPLGATYFAFSTVLIACMSLQQLHHAEEKKDERETHYPRFVR